MVYSKLELDIEKSKDDIDILKVDKCGKSIYIGSKYNMNAFIEKFLDNLKNDIEEESFLIIYGFGSGEMIRRLGSEFDKENILVFEPNLNLKNYIFSQPGILENKNIKVICDESIDIAAYITEHVNFLNLNKIKIATFANYENIYDKEYKIFREQINNVIKNHIIDTNTRIKFNGRWFEATMRNIPYILNSIPINNYTNKFKNKPAIIVSAGPSLEKNINELGRVKDTMMVLSGGRTLKPLLDINVNPHMLAVVDPDNPSYHLVEDYIENIDIPLFFYEKTNEQVVENHQGKKVFFTQSDIVREIVDQDVVDCVYGGSVAHTMTRIALEMGCNPIIFIGQDLAYTDNKNHAAIAKYKNAKTVENTKIEMTDCFVEDINGDKVRTSALLNNFRLELEELIRRYPEVEFINATEGGAKIKGTRQLALKECIDKYSVTTSDFSFGETEINLKDRYNNAIKVLNEFNKAQKRIKQICNKSLNLLDDLKFNYRLKKMDKVNHNLNKLNELDVAIKLECKKFKDLETLLYPIMYKAIVNKRNDDKASGLDSILNNNRELYVGIIEEIEKVNNIVNTTINELEIK